LMVHTFLQVKALLV